MIPNEEQIKKLIEENLLKKITIKEVAEALSISRKTAEIYLLRMQSKGILKIKESSKSEGYVYRWWSLNGKGIKEENGSMENISE